MRAAEPEGLLRCRAQRDPSAARRTGMTRRWVQRVALVALGIVVTGCSSGPVQCKPCMSSGAFYVDGGRQPAGTAVRLCMEGHGCSEQIFPRESDTSNTVLVSENITLEGLYGVDHAGLDGETVTATLTPPGARAASQTVTAPVAWIDGGDGECSCSYLSTESLIFRPSR
jgi:hypothetical protein